MSNENNSNSNIEEEDKYSDNNSQNLTIEEFSCNRYI